MKHLFALAAAVALLVASYPSTGLSQAQSPEDPVMLRVHTFFGGSTHGLWERDMIAAYQEANPNVRINLSTTGLYRSPVPLRSLVSEVEGDDPPDVILGFIGHAALLSEYIEAGRIADISPLWEEMGWHDDYPDSVLEAVSRDGQQYFVPMALQWNPIFYRQDIFEQEDIAVPQTWEALLSVCQTLNERGYRPFTMSTSNWNPPTMRWFTMLNLRLNGADFHRQLMAGEVSWEDERVRTVFEHWQIAFENGCFGDDVDTVNYRDAVAEITDGEAVMYLLGEWLYESTEEETEALLDFFRFPVMNEDVPLGAIAHYYGAYMLADTEHPEAVLDFLRYLGSPDVQSSIVTDQQRAVMTAAIDREDVMPDYQQRGVTYVAESEQLVPLFEVSMIDHQLANRGLSLLSAYTGFWNEPDAIDRVLSGMEETRLTQLEMD